MDKRFLSVVSYIAGCLLVAIIYLAINWDKGYVYLYSGSGFVALSILSTLWMWNYFISNIPSKKENTQTSIRRIRRNNNFVASSISYYVIPFLSFINTGIENSIILGFTVSFFAFVHWKNRMFLFSPVIDMLGYNILDCEIKIGEDFIPAYVITNEFNSLYTSGENECYQKKVDEGVFFVSFL